MHADEMLKGVRILDLSRLLPGPAATWYLGALGAQVDRVESIKGDLTRFLPPKHDNVGAYFAAVSRGKRSIACNFRHEGFSNLIRSLLNQYDVVVEGFRPGRLSQMGLDPDELRKEYPKIIIASISGFGQNGDLSQQVAHDINYLGYTGALAAMLGPDGIPLPSFQAADMSAALTAAMGISAALVGRERTGEGIWLDVSLTESVLSLYAPMITGLLSEHRDPRPQGELLSGGAAIYGCYRCADDLWIAVGAVEAKFQNKIARYVTHLTSSALMELFASKDRAHWLSLLGDACVTPVLNVSDLPRLSHFEGRGVFDGVFVQPNLGKQSGVVPKLGEHTQIILSEAGYDSQEVEHFYQSGLVV
ncbi:MAG: hypothetical protein CMK59_08480 [Proteobacteria bacterium]|nr:hypothetical protein [Pseudomonadota bacterium]